MRVLIAGGGTGGHLMPALALADALAAAKPGLEAVLVGARRGVEAELLPRHPYRYHLLPAEPLYRRSWWRNLRWPITLARVLRAGRRVLAEERPALAVGTGGYAAGPVLWQATRRGIPLVLQEQNAYPGFTTRRLARRARQVHLGYGEAARHLRPGSRTEVIESGNPIVPPPSPRPDKAAARAALSVASDVPVVAVVGGSQGSAAINRAVAGAVEFGLLDHVTLLWSTGRYTWDRYGGLDAPPRRLVRPFWDPIAEVYGAADLVVARSGAMTTAELAAWGLPSVLIPLPTAAAKHQSLNALALEASGGARHLPERELTPDRLVATVSQLLADPERLAAMGRAAASRGHPNAAREIAEHILALVS